MKISHEYITHSYIVLLQYCDWNKDILGIDDQLFHVIVSRVVKSIKCCKTKTRYKVSFRCIYIVKGTKNEIRAVCQKSDRNII